jgi:type VI secretion system protein ImpA
VNTVSFLTDQGTTIKSLRTTPIVSSRLVGRFSLREIDIAKGEIPPPDGEEPIKSSTIDAAFNECDLEDLRANTNAARDGLQHIDAIESVITQQVGAARAVSLESLRHTLRDMYVVLEQNLQRRDVAAEVPGEAAVAASGDGGPAAAAGRLTGEIQSREDVIKALEKICQYYARHEPSSPLPLLLTRAKRLASKSFLEIVQDLTPDALGQIQALAGSDNDGSGG